MPGPPVNWVPSLLLQRCTLLPVLLIYPFCSPPIRTPMHLHLSVLEREVLEKFPSFPPAPHLRTSLLFSFTLLQCFKTNRHFQTYTVTRLGGMGAGSGSKDSVL